MPEAEINELRALTQEGMKEIRYQNRNLETINKFYNIIVGNTLTSDVQTKFLFDRMNHLMVPTNILGQKDLEITKDLRKKGDLGGQTQGYTGESNGKPVVVLEIQNLRTQLNSYSFEYVALPFSQVEYNQRLRHAVQGLLGASRDLSRGEIEQGLTDYLQSNRKDLQRITLSDSEKIFVLPNRSVGVGLVGNNRVFPYVPESYGEDASKKYAQI